ncbi:RIP metalloprotease RseP [Desulforamulus hydrothermalis]|uniref:Zinc metalloprotease n=1 Tax=Desulforamulus hydrothermalis Lam5 = DSM 18033 TaxID=1121428 RepID=K8ELT7_9FIRM|nr:RIP metalloprotease RseP [Desulforamulus hydrothermalis]CCO09436.1 Site-2 protease, Metallo peptidase, MEROPS family M50B [Desulforamulus hydrothermalis Lam5 = DSM 18033]SHH08190.1 regulator of sigma E protease [Desulforamulus hydrothermalis Lam5 = DSM 18033]
MQTFIASVVVFGLLIFFHELGHFLVAKRVGILVHEFSLGFGPKIIGFHRGGTRYNLRLLPLGGFVRMAGMDPNEEADKDIPVEQTFNHKSAMQRAAVIIAGPLMNFVLAAVLFALILMVQGVPDPSTTKVGEVLAGSPAQQAGLQIGDVIVAVNNQPVQTWDQLVAATNRTPGQPLQVKVRRDNQELNLTATAVKDKSGQYKMGIKPALKKMDPFSALAKGTSFTIQISGLILAFLGQMFTQQAPLDLGGPVRVVSEIGKAAEFGIFQVMQLAAFLSINLGLFNLLPIPALDGSRVLFLLWEKISGRPVEPSKESFIHLIGFGLLLLLMVVITYNDIVSLMFGNR